VECRKRESACANDAAAPTPTPTPPHPRTKPKPTPQQQVLVVAGGVQGARQIRRWVHAAQAQQRALTLDLQRAAAKKAAAHAAASSSGGGAAGGAGAAARRGGAGVSAVAVDARFFRRLMVILKM
jgi:hypothetical protein